MHRDETRLHNEDVPRLDSPRPQREYTRRRELGYQRDGRYLQTRDQYEEEASPRRRVYVTRLPNLEEQEPTEARQYPRRSDSDFDERYPYNRKNRDLWKEMDYGLETDDPVESKRTASPDEFDDLPVPIYQEDGERFEQAEPKYRVTYDSAYDRTLYEANDDDYEEARDYYEPDQKTHVVSVPAEPSTKPSAPVSPSYVASSEARVHSRALVDPHSAYSRGYRHRLSDYSPYEAGYRESIAAYRAGRRPASYASVYQRVEAEYEVPHPEISPQPVEMPRVQPVVEQTQVDGRSVAIFFDADFQRRHPSVGEMLESITLTPRAVFFAKDREGHLVAVNQEMISAKNAHDAAEILGCDDYDFFPPSVAAHHIAEDQRVLATGEPQTEQTWFAMDRAGRAHWFACQKAPLHDADGGVVGVIGYRHALDSEDAMRDQFQDLYPVIQHLEAHYREPAVPAYLASVAGLSVAELEQCFGELMGMTINSFLEAYRVERSRQLLACTDHDMVDIAYLAGFHDVHEMSYQFQVRNGIDPREYRERFRTLGDPIS